MTKPLTHNDLVALLGEALQDSKFREQLLQSPTKTLQARGFKADHTAVEFFKSLSSSSFDHAARQIAVKSAHDPIERAGDC